MKNLFKVYLKKAFSDFHSAIVCIIVCALILSVGGIWVFSKNLWILLKTTMLLPTPLWVTAIFLALFVMAYFYLKNKKSIPLSTPFGTIAAHPEIKSTAKIAPHNSTALKTLFSFCIIYVTPNALVCQSVLHDFMSNFVSFLIRTGIHLIHFPVCHIHDLNRMNSPA